MAQVVVFVFTPKLGGSDSIFEGTYIFSIGCFNHQGQKNGFVEKLKGSYSQEKIVLHVPVGKIQDHVPPISPLKMQRCMGESPM